MQISFGTIAVALCLALLPIVPAEAVTVVSTYTGTVEDFTQQGHTFLAVDNDGIFGAPGASLAGDQFSIVFTFDTQLGLLPTDGTGLGGYATTPVTTSPALSVSLTINGITYSSSGSSNFGIYGSAVVTTPDQPLNPAVEVTSLANFPSASYFAGPVFHVSEISDLEFVPDLSGTFLKQCVSICGNFSIDAGQTYGILNFATFDVAGFGPVFTTAGLPEPGEWLMLLAGFAILGCTIRGTSVFASAQGVG